MKTILPVLCLMVIVSAILFCLSDLAPTWVKLIALLSAITITAIIGEIHTGKVRP